MKALVSILIPTYNREAFIEETLMSALSQTYDSIEVVVVDNASTDDTWAILNRISKSDPRVRIFQNAENLGPVRNWLACVEKAQGQYSKILWSDDLIAPDYIEETLPFFEDRDVGFVYTSAQIFSSQVSDAKCTSYQLGQQGTYPSSVFIEGALLGKDMPLSPGCAIFRTEDVKKNLLLNIPNRIQSDFSMHAIGNDLLLFLRTAGAYPSFGFVDKPLSFFRAHEGSISIHSKRDKLELMYNIAKAYFVQGYTQIDTKLAGQFNAHLWVESRNYDFKSFGIHTLEGFYPEPVKLQFDFIYMLKSLNRLRKLKRQQKLNLEKEDV